MRLRTVLGFISLLVSVMIGVTASTTSVMGQETLPQHPADIRVGGCASLGEVVVPLSPLVVPDGDPQGEAEATPVAQSVTEVPLLLLDLLAESHSVVISAAPDQIDTPMACGEIGGTLLDDGTLSVGLPAMNGATRSGVASFAPTAAGEATLVTVLLVAEPGGRERRDAGGDAGRTGGDEESGTSAADPGAEAAGAGGEGAGAADGVGNVEVGPAPERARGTDAADPTDAANTSAGVLDAPPGVSAHPGADGAVDRVGRDRDRDHAGQGEAGKDEAGKGARSGEDGPSSQ